MKPAKQTPCSCGSGRPWAQCCGQAVPPSDEINALIALYNTRRYAELESRARLLSERYPDFGFGWQLLGGALQMQGKDALHAFRKTAQLLPGDAVAHYNLGVAQKSVGHLDEAVASYRRAVALKPDFVEAHGNLSDALNALGQHDEARISHRRVLQLKHDLAEAHNNQGVVLMRQLQFDGAEAQFRRAIEFKPDFARAHNNLGIALLERGQSGVAVASFRSALQLNPDSADPHSNMGNALRELGQLDEAVASYRRALQINPKLADVHVNLGNALKDTGAYSDALDSYRRALALKPDFLLAQTNLLFCLSHGEALDAQTLFAEHCRFGEQFEAPLRANWPQHGNSRNPERSLQIGFVSGDFRNHPVSYFIEPVLAHLSTYRQLSLHAYYNHTIEDSVTQRLRGYLTHWHQVAGLSDDALAQKIRMDGIDILIDLSGHTGKSRLLTFARKPAPVQASWMGYPGTTGLHAMDYYFADRFFLPPGQFENQFTEKIVHLPANAPFLPAQEAPSVNTLPALNNGYMTFGSFNRPSKLNQTTIALWSQLLIVLPDSKMLLGGMNKNDNCNTLVEWFAQEGIARDRLDFHAHSDMQRYLALHHQVDICLDTFPYNGGTTTLHALWMGVPTLTLAGQTAASRQGASILGHAGLEAFVAHDAADFVQKGLSWAGNLATLSDIRTGLRERFARSAMGQPAVIAAGLERALRIMWQRWCAGLPPAAIDVSKNQTTHEAGPSESKINGNPGNQGR